MFLFIGEEEGEGGNGLDSARCGNSSAWLGCLLVRSLDKGRGIVFGLT